MTRASVRQHMRAMIAFASAGLAFATVGIGSARAAATICDGSLFGPVSGNVVVPAGAGCTMSATVTGNVTLEEGAGLLSNDTTIGGNLIGKNAGQISLDFVAVHGNVRMSGDPSNPTVAAALTQIAFSTIDGSVDVSGAAILELGAGTTVGKNVTLTDGTGVLTVDSIYVAGSMTVNGNAPGAQITNNTIGKNLSCSGNALPITVFSNNVGGNASGQCAAP
jgi:hypothetical protein